jgi:hypothetical protein
MQRFDPKFASLLWFFIGYWILKARLDFYPASFYSLDAQNRNYTVNIFFVTHFPRTVKDRTPSLFIPPVFHLFLRQT